jgi:hypothetical protein
MADNYLLFGVFLGNSTAEHTARIGYSRDETIVRLTHGSGFDDTVDESMHLVDDSTSYQNTSGKTAYAMITVNALTNAGDRAYKIWSSPNDNDKTSGTEVFDSTDVLTDLNLFDADDDKLTSYLVPITNNHYIVVENTSGASSRNISVGTDTGNLRAFVIEQA